MTKLFNIFAKVLFITVIFNSSISLYAKQEDSSDDANSNNNSLHSNSCFNESAVKQVKTVIDKILVKLEQHKNEVSGNTQLVYKIIDELMVPEADFKVMSKLVLTRHWKKLNEEQQKAFIKEFSRLIIRTYGVAFESYNGETVSVHCPLRKLSSKNDRVEVSSTIHHLKQPENDVKFRLIKAHYDKDSDHDKKQQTTASDCDNCQTIKNECQELFAKCTSIKSDIEQSTDNSAVEQLGKNYEACKDEYDQCKSKYNDCKNNCSNDKDNKDEVKRENAPAWKVYDLIIDGVSIIDSYRQVFADKFRKEHDANKIISDMHDKNCEKNKNFCDK